MDLGSEGGKISSELEDMSNFHHKPIHMAMAPRSEEFVRASLIGVDRARIRLIRSFLQTQPFLDTVRTFSVVYFIQSFRVYSTTMNKQVCRRLRKNEICVTPHYNLAWVIPFSYMCPAAKVVETPPSFQLEATVSFGSSLSFIVAHCPLIVKLCRAKKEVLPYST